MKFKLLIGSQSKLSKLSNVQKNALERYFTIDTEVIQDNTRIAV